jgi:hypothetical protein
MPFRALESSPLFAKTASPSASHLRLSCGCLRGRLACGAALEQLRGLALAYAEGVRTGYWGNFNARRCAIEAHYIENG